MLNQNRVEDILLLYEYCVLCDDSLRVLMLLQLVAQCPKFNSLRGENNLAISLVRSEIVAFVKGLATLTEKME